MRIDFDNIFQHVIPMYDFGRKWRFTDEKYDKLPDTHLNQLKPLDKEAALFLWSYIAKSNLHKEFPFKKDYFHSIVNTKILDGNENDIKKWLYHLGIHFEEPVFLSWDESDAMIVPWKLFIKYFNSFYYGGSDDLTIIDQSLNWALLFFHEDEIYFGKNMDFSKNEISIDIDLIY